MPLRSDAVAPMTTMLPAPRQHVGGRLCPHSSSASVLVRQLSPVPPQFVMNGLNVPLPARGSGRSRCCARFSDVRKPCRHVHVRGKSRGAVISLSWQLLGIARHNAIA
jgi:hypothetical protein